MKSSVRRWQAAVVSAGLSILFVAVYGGCNWITSRRVHVSSFYFKWEHMFPFVPLMIPAYMSLDLFFIGAFFLCRTNEELRVYSKRIAAAILIAGSCFLLFPLRFAFPRPEASGVLGVAFDWFRDIDAPYNLLPSLHAALLLLVGSIYLRPLRGNIRIASLCWFILIGVSPLLTYQHHLIDILAGFVLAAYCFYFFSNRLVRRQVTNNYRVGLYYAAGAVMLVIVTLVFHTWTMLLWWPAIALTIVSSSYFGGGPGVYRKIDGRLPWSARLVLAPCLVGQYLSLVYYRRKCRPWDAVTEKIWIGGRLTRAQANEALRSGVTAVLDLTAEFSEPRVLRAVSYRNIPVVDLTTPTQSQLLDIARFIADRNREGIVYVHCKIGFSRSAAAIAAYLIMSGHASGAREAFAIIRRARPSIVIRPEVVAALDQFESCHQRAQFYDRTFLLALAGRALA